MKPPSNGGQQDAILSGRAFLTVGPIVAIIHCDGVDFVRGHVPVGRRKRFGISWDDTDKMGNGELSDRPWWPATPGESLLDLRRPLYPCVKLLNEPDGRCMLPGLALRDSSSHIVIVAVVVTYLPSIEVLDRLLNALSPQVDRVVVVDNGSGPDLAAWMGATQPTVEFMRLEDNLGIAAAQNVGIGRARELKADFVLLSDQDSLPAPDMVSQLVAVAKAQALSGARVAAVGPRYIDERQNNPPPFIRIKGLRVERQPCPSACSVAEVDYLIASGCLIPMTTLDIAGGMDEHLFIDYVDIEWGLRAAHHGFQAYGACAARMHHDLGEEPIEFLGRRIPLHSPVRHYYHFRNAVWLYRQSWLRLNWKFADGWRLLLKYGFYTLFAKPRHRHWWMMSRGIWDGLRGRMGPLK